MMLRNFSIPSVAWPARRCRAKTALLATGLLTALALSCGAVQAQTNAPRPSDTAPAPVDEGPTGTGGITRALLTAQGDGRRAAPAQPTLGVVATAAFDRYLDSFKLPIPQWFQQRVQTDESQ